VILGEFCFLFCDHTDSLSPDNATSEVKCVTSLSRALYNIDITFTSLTIRKPSEISRKQGTVEFAYRADNKHEFKPGSSNFKHKILPKFFPFYFLGYNGV
jgi:hypothetical protein